MVYEDGKGECEKDRKDGKKNELKTMAEEKFKKWIWRCGREANANSSRHAPLQGSQPH